MFKNRQSLSLKIP